MLVRSGSVAEYGDRWSFLCEIMQLCQALSAGKPRIPGHMLSHTPGAGGVQEHLGKALCEDMEWGDQLQVRPNTKLYVSWSLL